MNWIFRQWQEEIRGTVVDLACGCDPSSLRGLVQRTGAKYVGLDFSPACRPTVVADLKQPLPFGDAIADVVIVANFLYITPEPQKFLEEARRVLVLGGTVMLVAPLVWQFYPEPTDYWRFTSQALEYLLKGASFDDITILPLGGRWASAAHLISPFLHPGRIVRPIVHSLCAGLDRFAQRVLPWMGGPVPLGYCVKARAA